MKTTNSQSSMQDNRGGLSEVLQGINPTACLVIGLVICAVVAYYIPLIIIALTGVWVNNLTMMSQLLIFIIVLGGLNLLGNRFNKILLVNIVAIVVIDCYEVYSTMTGPVEGTLWKYCWMVFFLPTVAFLLNAWFFIMFKAVAGLNGKPGE